MKKDDYEAIIILLIIALVCSRRDPEEVRQWAHGVFKVFAWGFGIYWGVRFLDWLLTAGRAAFDKMARALTGR